MAGNSVRRTVYRLGISAFSCVALVSAATASAGEPSRSGRTSALSWVRQPGAEGCIGAPALAAAVEERLRRRVFVPPSDAEVSVEGSIAPVAGKRAFHATFRVADREGRVLGTRELEKPAATCELLADDLAFVVSVLIDPEAALGGAPAPEPAPEPVPAPAPAGPEPLPPPNERPSPETPPRPWRWLAGVDFGGAGGLVPDVGWVVGAGAIVTPPRWPGLRLRGSSFLPSSHPIENGARADVSLVMGELGVCPLELRSAPFGATACLGGLLGELSARGQGFSDSRGTSALLGAASVAIVAELDLGSVLALTLAPSVVVPLSRATLAYDTAAGTRQTFYETGSIAASLSVGVAVGSR
jgi:hypothetical protein